MSNNKYLPGMALSGCQMRAGVSVLIIIVETDIFAHTKSVDS